MKFATQISPLHNFINFIISLGQQAHWVKIEREYSGSLPRKGPVVYWLGKRSTLTFWFGNGAWRDQQQQKNSYISFWQRCLKRPTTKKPSYILVWHWCLKKPTTIKKLLFLLWQRCLKRPKKTKNSYISVWQWCLNVPTLKKTHIFHFATVLEETNKNKKTLIFRFGNSAWRDQKQQKNSYISVW